jgi:hypothetical protein
MADIEKTDIVIEDPVIENNSNNSENTGYIFNLTEEQIVRIIHFFASRRNTAKALKTGSGSRLDNLTAGEMAALKEILSWFGIKPYRNSDLKKAYKTLVARFKMILEWLKVRPAFITTEIHKALEEGGYKRTLKNVVLVVDKDRKVVPKVVTGGGKNVMPPIGKADQMLWEIQNMTLDKIMLILESIKPKDIKNAGLGVKSKALRDMFSMYHMSRLNNKNPNLTLVNFNVYQADKDEKLKVYQAYINRNKEN